MTDTISLTSEGLSYVSAAYEAADKTDKACDDARDTARILAAFNLQLVDMGVHEVTTNKLTEIYANKVLAKGKGGP